VPPCLLLFGKTPFPSLFFIRNFPRFQSLCYLLTRLPLDSLGKVKNKVSALGLLFCNLVISYFSFSLFLFCREFEVDPLLSNHRERKRATRPLCSLTFLYLVVAVRLPLVFAVGFGSESIFGKTSHCLRGPPVSAFPVVRSPLFFTLPRSWVRNFRPYGIPLSLPFVSVLACVKVLRFSFCFSGHSHICTHPFRIHCELPGSHATCFLSIRVVTPVFRFEKCKTLLFFFGRTRVASASFFPLHGFDHQSFLDERISPSFVPDIIFWIWELGFFQF